MSSTVGDPTASGNPDLEDRFERAACGLLSMTTDGLIVEVNETFLEWSGYDRASLLGTPFPELLDIGAQLFYETRYLPVLRLDGEVREVALTMRKADGSTLPILVNSRMSTKTPRPLVRTAVFDSTGRQEYERELLAARRKAEFSEARVRVLQDSSTAFGAAYSETELAEALVDSGRNAFSASAAAVLLVGADGRLALAAGEHPLDSHPSVAALHRDAIDRSSPVLLANVDDADRAYPGLGTLMHAARVEALSVVPIRNDGVAVGVLLCLFGRERAFDEQAVDLMEALGRQAGQVLSRVRLQAQLERLALHDQLTGLANRKLLHEQASKAIASSDRSARSLAVMFLDLDGFKPINDRLGHGIGDSVLREVAARLLSVVRQGDTVGRYGGDEFVVICEDTDHESATAIAERLRSAINAPLDGVAREFPISASIGIALYQPGTSAEATTDELIRAADAAMYESKQAGRDRFTVAYI
jgi:diguanylate cyclase (GGDEF)-like protein/PAS domain S-box-containing protein